MSGKARRIPLMVLTMALVGLPGLVNAQVWVNGQQVQGAQLQQLEAAYGERIPPGRYWLDQYGNWGYEGNYQSMGNLYTDNRGYSSQGQSGGAWVDNHGSSGTVMKDSDGCMYFSGGGVSASNC